MESAGLRKKSQQVDYQDPDVIDVDEDYDDDHDRPKRRRSYRQPSRRLRSSSPESSGEDVIAAQPRSGRAPPRTRQHRFRHTREEEEAVIKIVHPLNKVAPHLPMSIDKPEKPFSRPVVDHYGEFPDDDFQVQLDLRTPRDPSLPKREFHEHDYIIYLRKPESWDTLTNLEQWRIKRDTLENKYGKGRFIFWGSADFMGDVGAPPNQIMVRHVFARFEVVRRFEPSDIADFWENSKDRLAFLESCDELNHVEIEFSKDALLDYEKGKHYELPEDENEEERIRRAQRYTPAGIRKSKEHYAQVRAAQDAAIDERDRLDPRGPSLKRLRELVAERDARDRALEARNHEREQWLRENPPPPVVRAPVNLSEADAAAEQVEHEKRRMQAFKEDHFQAYDSLMNAADAEHADPLVVASQPMDWQEAVQPAPALTDSASDSEEDVYAVTASGRAELMRMAQRRAEFDQLGSRVNDQVMGVNEMMEEFGQLEQEANEQQEDIDQTAEAVGQSDQVIIQQPEITEQVVEAVAPTDLEEELPVIPTTNSLSGLEKVSPGLLSGLSGFNLAAFVPEVLQHADSTQGDTAPIANQHEGYEDDDADADGEEDTTGDLPSAQPPPSTEVSATTPNVADPSEPLPALKKRKRVLDLEDEYDDDEEDNDTKEHAHENKKRRLNHKAEEPVAITTTATSVSHEADPHPITSTSASIASQQQQPQSPRLPIEKLIAKQGQESRQRHEENRRAAQLSARVTNSGEALNVTASAAAAGSLLSQLGAAGQASNPPAASNTTTTTAAAATASVPSQPSAVPDTTNVTPADITTPGTAIPPVTETPATTVSSAATATPVPSQPATIPDTSAIPASVTTSIPTPDVLPADAESTFFNVDSTLGKRSRDEYDVTDDLLAHMEQFKRAKLDPASALNILDTNVPTPEGTAADATTGPVMPIASVPVPDSMPVDAALAPVIPDTSVSMLVPAPVSVASALYDTQSTLGKRGRDADVEHGPGSQLGEAKRAKVDTYLQPAQNKSTALGSTNVAPPTTSQRAVRGSDFLDFDLPSNTDDLPGPAAEATEFPIPELLGPVGPKTPEGKYISIVNELADSHERTVQLRYQQRLTRYLTKKCSGERCSQDDMTHMLMAGDEFSNHERVYKTERLKAQSALFSLLQVRHASKYSRDEIKVLTQTVWHKNIAGVVAKYAEYTKLTSTDFDGPENYAQCQLTQYWISEVTKAQREIEASDDGSKKHPLYLARQVQRAMSTAMASQLTALHKSRLEFARLAREETAKNGSAHAQGSQARSQTYGQVTQPMPLQEVQAKPAVSQQQSEHALPELAYTQTPLLDTIPVVSNIQNGTHGRTPLQHGSGNAQLPAVTPSEQSHQGPGPMTPHGQGSAVPGKYHLHPVSPQGHSMPETGPTSSMKVAAVPQHGTSGLWQPGLRPHSPGGRRIGRIERELSQSPRPSAPAPIFDLTGEDEEDFDVSRVNIDNVDETPRQPQVNMTRPATPTQRVSPQVAFTPHAMAAFAQTIGQLQRDMNPVEHRMQGRGQQRSRHESQAQDDILRRAASRATGNHAQNKVQKRSRAQKKATKSLAEPSSSTAPGTAPEISKGQRLDPQFAPGHMQPAQYSMGPGGMQENRPLPDNQGQPYQGSMMGQKMPQQFTPLQQGAQMLPPQHMPGHMTSTQANNPHHSPQMPHVYAQQIHSARHTPTPMPSVPAGPRMYYSPNQIRAYPHTGPQMVPNVPANLGNTQGRRQMLPNVPADMGHAQTGRNITASSQGALPRSTMERVQAMMGGGGVQRMISQAHPQSNVQMRPLQSPHQQPAQKGGQQETFDQIQQQIHQMQARLNAARAQAQQQIQPPAVQQFQPQAPQQGPAQSQYQGGHPSEQQIWQQNPPQTGYQGQQFQPPVLQQTQDYGQQPQHQSFHQPQPEAQQLTPRYPPQPAPPKRRRPARLGAGRNNLDGRVQAQRIEPATIPPLVEQPVTNQAPVTYESMNAEVAAALGRSAPERQGDMSQYPEGSPQMH